MNGHLLARTGFGLFCGINFIFMINAAVFAAQGRPADPTYSILGALEVTLIYMYLIVEIKWDARIMLILLIISIMSMMISLSQENLTLLWFALGVPVTFIYNRPGTSVRNIPLVKNVYIALVWSGSFLFFAKHFVINNLTVVILLSQFILILILSVMSDILDLQEDISKAHSTASRIWPIPIIVTLLLVLIFSYTALMIFYVSSPKIIPVIIATVLIPFCFLIVHIARQKIIWPWYSKYLLDFSIILHCLILLNN